ncbi:MAG: LiaF transmembrane domain-containing protein [Bacteroidota bacterium]
MKNHSEKRYVLGVILLFAGLALLLRFWDLLPWHIPSYVFSWKSLLVFLGLVFMASHKDKSTGLILFTIGAIFLGADITGFSIRDVFRFVFPVVLIIAGLAIIIKRQSFTPNKINVTEGAEINDYINEINIFGGGERIINTRNFLGGKITAIFGGAELDMRKADMAPGVNAVDMLCIFGGVSMRLPEDWIVKNDVTAIFGGFSDERNNDKDIPTDENKKILYLKGLVMFGGGELKS